MTANTLRFAQTRFGPSWVRAFTLALLIGGAGPAWSADPFADPFMGGKWSLTYHLTVKPGHETYTVPGDPGTTVTHTAYLTHVCQPAFTVNPDGKFAFTADDTGYNRNEHDGRSPGGAGTGKGKWQVYLKVREGQVDADGKVVRLTLDQALGSGSVTTESGGMMVRTDATTTRDSDTLAVVVHTPNGTGNYQLPKAPGGYTPFSKWGSQKWELNKTSQEGTTTIYSAARDVQLGGGLVGVETVEVQRKIGPDLEVTFQGTSGPGTWNDLDVPAGGLLDVNVLVTNVGDEPSVAAELTILFSIDYENAESLTAEVLDQGTGIANGRSVETGNRSVTFRVGRLEPKPKPGNSTNATARFRIRMPPVLNEGEQWRLGMTGGLGTVSAEVKSSQDPNNANNSDYRPCRLRGKK